MARVWDVQTGQTILIYTNQGPEHVNRVALSPDGKLVATSGDDDTARIWELLTGKEVRRLTGHNAEVRDVAFAPDGKYILTTSFDGTAQLWFTDIHDTIRAVCSLLTRDLMFEERIQFGVSDQGPTCPAQ